MTIVTLIKKRCNVYSFAAFRKKDSRNKMNRSKNITGYRARLAASALTAAFMTAAGAVSVFAAQRGWVNEGDSWYYYDNSGEAAADKWKSYGGDYYYLGDDGAMLTDSLIEDGTNHYYVDANGKMVRNAWIAVPADEDETEDVDYRWYYFGPSGKAYANSVGKTINGKKYGFDADGRMLFGFVEDKSSLRMINDEEDAIIKADYYFGTNDDGERHTGWLRYEDGLTEYDDADENVNNGNRDHSCYWFWYGTNGEKRTSAKKINGHKYNFDENGVMLTSFDDAATASEALYYSDNIENGSLQKNSWIWTSAPKSWGIDDDDEHWFRTDGKGQIITDTTKKIDGKFYVFDENGIMQHSLVFLKDAKKAGNKIDTSINGHGIENGVVDTDVATAEDIIRAGMMGGKLYFFGHVEKLQGSMQTGKKLGLLLADDSYHFGFDKNTGAAYNRIVDGRAYLYGIRLAARDTKYAQYNYGGKNILVNGDGKIQKKGIFKDDGYGYYVVKDGEVVAGSPFDTKEEADAAYKAAN